MSPKTDKLAQRVQGLQKFVSERASQDEAYTVIKEALQELGESLKIGQISLHIVSQDVVFAQTLYKLLSTSETLRNTCRLKACPLSEIPDSDAPLPPPTLVLQSSSNAQQSSRFELSANQNYIIGRNPSAANLLLSDNLGLVSGSHAELRSFKEGWQIQDAGSRNGIFVNGSTQKLQSLHQLKAGDRICLGSSSQAPGSATFIFESFSKADAHSTLVETKRLFNCNVLCLVIPAQPPSETVQQFLQLAKENQAVKLFIVVERQGGIDTNVFRQAFLEIENIIKGQLQSHPFELVSVLLQPFMPSSGATVLTPHAQPEFEQLCADLIDLTEGRTEELLIQWISSQLEYQISRIEATLKTQEESLIEAQKIATLGGLDELREQSTKTIREIMSDKDRTFRQIKRDFDQARGAILDGFSKRSAVNKIQQFTDDLRPVVTRQGKLNRVVLQSDQTIQAGGLQKALYHLCHSIVCQWSVEEWEKACNTHAEGGLQGFQQRANSLINFIPLSQPLSWDVPSAKSLNFEKKLQDSIVEPSFEIEYQTNTSPFDYLVKQFRSQAMQYSVMFGMGVSLFTGVSFLISRLLGRDTATQSRGHDMLQFMDNIPATWRVPIAVLVLTAIILTAAYLTFSLFKAYKQDETAKLQDATVKLKKEVVNFYQSLAKNFTDKLLQGLNVALDAEEQKATKAIEKLGEQVKLYTDNVKAQRDAYSSQLKSLNDSKNELKKL